MGLTVVLSIPVLSLEQDEKNWGGDGFPSPALSGPPTSLPCWVWGRGGICLTWPHMASFKACSGPAVQSGGLLAFKKRMN